MGRGKKEGREGKRLRLRWTRATVSGLAFPGRFCRRSRDVPSNAQENPVHEEPQVLELLSENSSFFYFDCIMVKCCVLIAVEANLPGFPHLHTCPVVVT